MVQGIGPTGSGSGGSIKDLSAYQTYYPMYEAYCQNVDDNLSFEAWLIMKGYIKNFNQQVENYIETGNEQRGDESKNTIDSNHHVSNGTGALYQSVDDDTYYEFDWESGTYKVITDKEDIADALGMPSGHNIDMINLGYMNAEITDITFGNLDDGQNSTTRDLYGNYANVSYTQQEFDIHYILDALLMNPNDPQYQIAKEIFDELCASTSQWLPDSDLEELNQIAEEFGVNSAEYKTRLQEILLANLDQAQEWVDDHAHVEYVDEGTLGSASDSTGTNGTTGTGSTEGTEGSSTTDVSSAYDKSSVLDAAGALGAYTQGTYKTGLHSKKDNNKNWDQAKTSAENEVIQYATSLLDSVATALASQLGEECTEEISNYISQAKTTALGNKGSWLSTESTDYNFWKGAKNKGYYGKCNSKALIDAFFAEFDTLCKNNGKTSEEVAAEQQAAQQQAEQQKEVYKTLYETDIFAAAEDADVDKNEDVSVVLTDNSTTRIKEKALEEVLQPLMNQIKSKLSGKGMSDSEIEKILDGIATTTLSKTSQWASTSNYSTYTIDTEKLISIFESDVKSAVKAKGYSF